MNSLVAVPQDRPFDRVMERPLQREGLLRRVLPFAMVAGLSVVSLALPPGPVSTGDAWGTVALLVLTGLLFLLPWSRVPAGLSVLVPITYAASVLLLVLAAGPTSGVGIVIILPLVWTALYHRRWESVVVVVTTVAVEVALSLTPEVAATAVILRKAVLWTAIGSLISVATHSLRARVSEMLASQEEAHRRTVALEEAAESLTAILRPDHVIEEAVRVAAEIVSPTGMSGRRAQYVRLRGDVVTVVVQHDETGQRLPDHFPLAEHPALTQVFDTRRAGIYGLDADHAGPIVATLVRELGVTHGLYIPITVDGVLDGVLSVSLRGQRLSLELFELSKALGHLVELALSNATSYTSLEELANTDELTGLPNRREFIRISGRRPGRFPFAILAMDLDGLKQVNDSLGHAAGDELLRHVATALQGSLRVGDVVARLGGDEFAAILFQADENDARVVGERILTNLSATSQGTRPSLSIGIAAGAANADAADVQAAADEAMYRAKQRGGGCYEVAQSSTVPHES